MSDVHLIERLDDVLNQSESRFDVQEYGQATGVLKGLLRGLSCCLKADRNSITIYLVDIIADDFDDLCELMTDEVPLFAVERHLLNFANYANCAADANLFAVILRNWIGTLDLLYLLEALQERHKADLLDEFEDNLGVCDFEGFGDIHHDADGTLRVLAFDPSGNELWVALAPNGKASACFGHHELEGIGICEAFYKLETYAADEAWSRAIHKE